MEIPETKRFIPMGFEFGTTLSLIIAEWVYFYVAGIFQPKVYDKNRVMCFLRVSEIDFHLLDFNKFAYVEVFSAGYIYK